MKKKQIKIVIAIAFIVIALGSVYAYTEFNRKATSTKDLKSEFNTSAAELIVEFE
jgi:flagellar basal body-associated protein FliL